MFHKDSALKRSRVALAAASMALIGLMGVAAPALADTFTPLNDPPSSNNITWLAGNVTASSFTPANPRSTTVYTVATDIGSQGGLANLSTVTLCIFDADAISPNGSGVTPCANAATDPKHIFEMVWTQSTDSFAVTGTNHYQNVSSVSNYGDGTALTATMNFKFKVSNAMMQGSNWVIRVEAVDDQAQVSATGELSPVAVDYFGAVTTQRTPTAFGDLLANGQSTRSGIASGAFLANGISYLTLEATDFANGSNTIAIDPNGAQWPPTGTVALDCEAAAVWNGANGVRVGTSATSFDWGLFSSGTGETADSSHVHSCVLTFGGGATVARVEYTSTVTIGIGWGI